MTLSNSSSYLLNIFEDSQDYTDDKELIETNYLFSFYFLILIFNFYLFIFNYKNRA